MANTKRENFQAIITILNENGHEDLVGVMEHEIELLNKKAQSKSKAKSVDHSKIDSDIMSVMNAIGNTATEITKALDYAYSVQKVTSALTRMSKENKVNRIKDKKKVVFAIVGEC